MGKTRSGKRKAKEAVETAELSETADVSEMEDEPIALVPSEPKKTKRNDADSDASFLGKPFPQTEAAQRWPNRYQPKVPPFFLHCPIAFIFYLFLILVFQFAEYSEEGGAFGLKERVSIASILWRKLGFIFCFQKWNNSEDDIWEAE